MSTSKANLEVLKEIYEDKKQDEHPPAYVKLLKSYLEYWEEINT